MPNPDFNLILLDFCCQKNVFGELGGSKLENKMETKDAKWKRKMQNGKCKMQNDNVNKRITLKMENAKKENT